MSKHHSLSVTFLLLWMVFSVSPSAQAQFHNGLQVEYGKNRVQYRDFNWQFHIQDSFEIYYYQGGKELAGAVAGIVENCNKDLKTFFGTDLDGPIQILLYNNVTEFRQSNIGVFNADDEGENIGGTAKIIGNKLFIYGSGDRKKLISDLTEGLSRIAIQQVLYRGSWQDAIKSGSTLHIPDWFTEGLVQYISDPNSAMAHAHIYDAARSGELHKIDRSNGVEAGNLGRAVWSYINDVYGKQAIANILYMVRISRSVEGGIRFATGMTLSQIISEVVNYSISQTPPEYSTSLPPTGDIKERRKAIKNGEDFVGIKTSPDGNVQAFIKSELGQLQVFVEDLKSGDVKRKAVHGNKLHRTDDDRTMQIAWHPNSQQFSYVIAEKGQPVLATVRLDEKKPVLKTLFRIDDVMGLDYSNDGRSIVFSGLNAGRSDLYIYRIIGNIQEPLWEDRFDDLYPRFTSDGSRIIFSSNRTDDTLRDDRENKAFASDLDLFIYDLASEELVLERVVSTPGVDERYPTPLPNNEFVYLAEYADGTQEVKWGWADSTIMNIDTVVHYQHFIDTRTLVDVNVPILKFFVDTTSNTMSGEAVSLRHFYRLPLGDCPQTSQRLTEQFSRDGYSEKDIYEFTPPEWNEEFSAIEADIHNYIFEAEKRTVKEKLETKLDSKLDPKLERNHKTEKVNTEIIKLRPLNYRLNYTLEKVQSQVNNAFGADFYRAYDGSISLQPGLGDASEIRISDLFDDKHIVAGFNIPGNLRNSTFGLAYFDLAGRVDKVLTFQRQGSTSLDTDNYVLIETASHYAKYRLAIPVDEVRSFRTSIGFRLDKNVTQGTEMFTLTMPNTWNTQVGLEMAWVHDNTRNLALNLREGMRTKVWSELFLNEKGQTFGTIGFDSRRYIKLYANSILAFRLAGNWSLGDIKLLHLLGGMDNAIAFSNNHGTPIDATQNYAYQASITPMRGFKSNARNGSNAAIANMEVRVPVWSTIFSTPSTSDFLHNLQIVGFVEAGSAWTGVHPYSEENTFNSTVTENNPITVTIDNNHQPIIYDFGWGVRSRLMGYWVCADFGWGIDNGMLMERRFSLSLNFDF